MHKGLKKAINIIKLEEKKCYMKTGKMAVIYNNKTGNIISSAHNISTNHSSLNKQRILRP